MKRILIASLLFCTFSACKGKHLAWVSDDKNQTVKLEHKKQMKTDINGVHFTFDDGPSLYGTPKVLDILKQYNLQAIFFVEGINIDGENEQSIERRQLLKRIYDEGHIIGNHTYNHKDLCRLDVKTASWELDKTNELIKNVIGVNVEFLRPPYGKKCHLINDLMKKRNLTPMYWDLDAREWQRDVKTHQIKTPQQIVDDVIEQYKRLHDEQGMQNMIIILHDTKKVTVELLPILLEALSKQQ